MTAQWNIVGSLVPLEPSAIAELSAPVRATFGAGGVIVVGTIFLLTWTDMVYRSIDASGESLPSTIFYGLAVHFVLLFGGLYIISQLAGLIGAANSVILGLTGLGLLIIAGLGFTVVGTGITGLSGDRRPWLGLVIGGGIAAVSLLALPLFLGIATWILVASLGVGGAAREWFHASYSTEDQIREVG